MGFSLRNRLAGGGGAAGSEERREKRGSWLAAAVLMLLVSSAGGAVLVCWALHFHPGNEQLWMVPVGLVVFGTPIVAWVSIFASEIRQKLDASAVKAGGCSDLPVVVDPTAEAAPAPAPCPLRGN